MKERTRNNVSYPLDIPRGLLRTRPVAQCQVQTKLVGAIAGRRGGQTTNLRLENHFPEVALMRMGLGENGRQSLEYGWPVFQMRGIVDRPGDKSFEIDHGKAEDFVCGILGGLLRPIEMVVNDGRLRIVAVGSQGREEHEGRSAK